MTSNTPAAVHIPTEEEYPSVHLLLLITGSVAAVKTGLLLDQLSTERCNIRIAATKAAFHFLRRAQPSKTGIPFQSIITDEQEWSEWQAMSDSVVHIELRRWADLVVIAPLNANTLAKMAMGLCDNLVSSVMRAWEVREKPVVVCPAMNSAMWTHPVTATQLAQLNAWYREPQPPSAAKESEAENSKTEAPATAVVAVAPKTGLPTPDALVTLELPATLREGMFQVVGPVSKRLACGDVGIGGMASVEDIAAHIRHTMELIREEKRRRVREARAAAQNGVAAPAATINAAPAAAKAADAAQHPSPAAAL